MNLKVASTLTAPLMRITMRRQNLTLSRQLQEFYLTKENSVRGEKMNKVKEKEVINAEFVEVTDN